MRFCDKCGSRMEITAEGFSCPRCGNAVRTEVRAIGVKRFNHRRDLVYVVDDLAIERERVDRTCPRCGNDEALRWVSSVLGEHAGVKQERTVEHLKCTRCGHVWGESR